MSYVVKEIFATLQGEGAQAGRTAVFCRFTGCNLWSGKEADRGLAICQFCDTDFVGTGPTGGRFDSASILSSRISSEWPGGRARRFVVLTGGEPLLQADSKLFAALHVEGFEIAIETNGTRPIPAGIDWVCVSPKMGAELVVTKGHELKVVVPQVGQDLAALERLEFEHFFLQPMDGPAREANTRLAIELCMKRPRWRLSLQTHKLLGIP
ncbi:MAG: 7-carboxy-7-deazaguanine synthase [Deltaproteobacteria bacterium]|nr:7-carboxy-7-deazaguanine synthase [Deltaproteobacteria bacterium]